MLKTRFICLYLHLPRKCLPLISNNEIVSKENTWGKELWDPKEKNKLGAAPALDRCVLSVVNGRPEEESPLWVSRAFLYHFVLLPFLFRGRRWLAGPWLQFTVLKQSTVSHMPFHKERLHVCDGVGKREGEGGESYSWSSWMAIALLANLPHPVTTVIASLSGQDDLN